MNINFQKGLGKITLLLCLVLCIFFYSLASLTFAATPASSYIYIVFSTDNFVGIEFRAYTDKYTHLFGSVGANYAKAGIRFSSQSTAGLYLSPTLYSTYKGEADFGIFAGWSTVVQNLSNVQFFIEGGFRFIYNKPNEFVIFGLSMKF